MTDLDTYVRLAYVLIVGGAIVLIIGFIYNWYQERKDKKKEQKK